MCGCGDITRQKVVIMKWGGSGPLACMARSLINYVIDHFPDKGI